jgi:hypothetical protein
MEPLPAQSKPAPLSSRECAFIDELLATAFRAPQLHVKGPVLTLYHPISIGHKLMSLCRTARQPCSWLCCWARAAKRIMCTSEMEKAVG